MHDITARTKGEDGGSLASAGTQVPGEAAIKRAPASTSLALTRSVAPLVFVALFGSEIRGAARPVQALQQTEFQRLVCIR